MTTVVLVILEGKSKNKKKEKAPKTNSRFLNKKLLLYINLMQKRCINLPENNSRPGDMYLPSFIAGQPAALDVTITSPLQASLISDAARTCGFALTLAKDREIGHYYQKCSDMGIHSIPLALETFGGLSETTRKTLQRIALLSDNRGFQPSGLSVAINGLTQAVSISNMRGSATMLIARDSRL